MRKLNNKEKKLIAAGRLCLFHFNGRGYFCTDPLIPRY